MVKDVVSFGTTAFKNTVDFMKENEYHKKRSKEAAQFEAELCQAKLSLLLKQVDEHSNLLQ